jgi:hypothetical protein
MRNHWPIPFAKLRSPLHDLRCLLPVECRMAETSGCKGAPSPVLQLNSALRGTDWPAVASLGFGQSGYTSSACGRRSGCGAENTEHMNLPTSWLCGATAPPRLRVCSKDAPVATHRVSKRNVLWKKGEDPMFAFRSVSWHCDIQFFNLCWKPPTSTATRNYIIGFTRNLPRVVFFHVFTMYAACPLSPIWDATHDSKFPTRSLHKQWFHLRWQV